MFESFKRKAANIVVKESSGQFVKEIKKLLNDEEIQKEIEVTTESISKDLARLKEGLFSLMLNLKKESENVYYKEIEEITIKKINELVQNNMVSGSNAIAVLYKKKNENKHQIFLAFMKDDVLLEKAKNKYINIEGEKVSFDLKEMFKENELIILK